MKRVALTLLLTLATALAVSAEALLDYERRVARAAEEVARVRAAGIYEVLDSEILRELLPPREQVDQASKRVTVDNAWLHEALDDYDEEDDYEKKSVTLGRIGDRLVALDAALARAAETALDPNADQESRAKIREILNRREYREREESRLSAFIKKIYKKVTDFLAELRDAFARLLGKIFGSAAEGSMISKVVVVMAIAAFLFLIVYIARQVKPRRRRGRKRTVLGEEVEAEATPGDLFEAAMAASRAGDLRAAVRKLYISLLYELSERNLVEIEESATNREYLARLSHFETLVPPLRHMTDRFDFAWYGLFPTSQEEFSAYLARYHEAVERARQLTPEPAK